MARYSALPLTLGDDPLILTRKGAGSGISHLDLTPIINVALLLQVFSPSGAVLPAPRRFSAISMEETKLAALLAGRYAFIMTAISSGIRSFHMDYLIRTVADQTICPFVRICDFVEPG